MNNWLENVWMALDTLRQHKLRSFLTVLGVIIGTMTVIVIAAFVSGIDARVAKEIQSFGTNSIYIYKFDPGFNFAPTYEERTRKPLSFEDAMAIQNECSTVTYVTALISPVDFTQGPMVERVQVKYKENQMSNATVKGVMPDFFKMGTSEIEEGRFFNESDNAIRADVVVIGSDVANTLMPMISALEKEIIINGRQYRVIGVMKNRDNFLVSAEDPGNENKSVYLPYASLMKIYPNLEDNFIMATAETGKLDAAVEEIRQVLRKRRKVPYNSPDSFGISTADNIVSQFQSITSGVFLLMVAISSVGLLVGGIGVMNIMLVSVTERTKEIGIRKAIGAKKRDIISQFLVEAATLTGLGGVLGILFGWIVAELVKLFMPTFIPLWAPITGFVVSVALGVGFGLWPAVKAAKLDPIEALRYE